MGIATVRTVPASGTTGASGISSPYTTTIDCTGCSQLWVCIDLGSAGGGNVTTVTVGAVTYAGVTMTNRMPYTAQSNGTASAMAIYSLDNPASGSNTFSFAWSGGTFGATRVTPILVGLSGTNGVGNIGTIVNPSTLAANSGNIGVTAASGNWALGFGAHGDVISGVGTGTLVGVINNYVTDTSGGCMACAEASGAGGTTNVAFNSSVTDHWIGCAFEVVAATGAVITPVNVMNFTKAAVQRAATW